MVDSFKYLGVHINEGLTEAPHTDWAAHEKLLPSDFKPIYYYFYSI